MAAPIYLTRDYSNCGWAAKAQIGDIHAHESQLLASGPDGAKALYLQYREERLAYVDRAVLRAERKKGCKLPSSYGDAVFINWTKKNPFVLPEVVPPPPAYSLDDPRAVGDMAFLEEIEEQQEDPEQLFLAADAAGYGTHAIEEALKLLNTSKSTADALVLADRRLLVATAAKASAAKVAIVPWTADDERDYQLKKEVKAVLTSW